MSEQIATRDRGCIGGWRVPVGSIVSDELKPCDHCGYDVNVLTVRTAEGIYIMPDDYHDRADHDFTVCGKCVDA